VRDSRNAPGGGSPASTQSVLTMLTGGSTQNTVSTLAGLMGG
jgi:hypothetical protein